MAKSRITVDELIVKLTEQSAAGLGNRNIMIEGCDCFGFAVDIEIQPPRPHNTRDEIGGTVLIKREPEEE